MIRTSITPDKADIVLAIPAEYIGKKLEVLLYAVEEVTEAPVTPAPTMAQFWGILSKETADDILQRAAESRNEWDRNF